MGVRKMTVILSHWHDDHVAGNEIFADCEIIAHRSTDKLLNRIDGGSKPPRPLSHP